MVLERVSVLGVPIDCVDMQRALQAVESFIERGDGVHFIVAANPEKVIAASENEKLAEALASASLVIPDGIGTVLAVRCKAKKQIARVAGVDLMVRLCELAQRKEYPVFLFGASEEVSTQVVSELAGRYPGIVIAGRHNGYVPVAKMDELIAQINASGAMILFLALGSPRQEEWMLRYGHALTGVKVCQGVGGTFDVVAGKVRRAPALFINCNLEWFYRLLTDPQRIVRQIALPRFVFRFLRDEKLWPKKA